MRGVVAELEHAAACLRRCGLEVAEAGRDLEQRAATAVWSADAADAFRVRMVARRRQAEVVGASLEHAARLLEGHAEAIAASALSRVLRHVPWL